MRRHTLVFLALLAALFLAASTNMPLLGKKKGRAGRATKQELRDTIAALRQRGDTIAADSLDSVAHQRLRDLNDTTKMDSLQLAIWKYNRHIDDSVRRDSLNRAKSNGIDAPVEYEGEDSLVYDALAKMAYLYGDAKVKYENMDLGAERVRIGMDSNTVHATGVYADTTCTELTGTPKFTMGRDAYESDTMAFNFKTKKGLISQVYTQQDDGFLTGERSKRMANGDVYLEHARYTTCDEKHPDFYIALSRAKVRPGKDVTFGPAHVVVADVPLPLAIPYGFFPFSKKYSSGFIMPTYGEESTRGFYMRDGGYYFAINDKIDLKLLGEIYTKGSWGFSAASNYAKRYKFSGTFFFSYQDTRTGDKGMPDYSKQTSYKIQWSHRQDAKANPYRSFSASVNFASSSYETNNLNSLYNPQTKSQSTRTSSVSWSTMFSSIGMTLSATSNLSQNTRDSTISLTLPDLNISVSRFYPFKRKKKVGDERWYEKISMSYTGQIRNEINTKENLLFKSNLLKDWRNGMQHNIPISGSFTLLKYLNINPSFNFTDRMYFNKINRSWDEARQVEVQDTTRGFYNVYNWSLSVSASTKIYGFFTPSRKLFGDKIQAIRHVITPNVSFSYSPDFSTESYGYYDSYLKTDTQGNVSLVEYSPYSQGLFGVPGRGKSSNINFSIDNNVEMKVRSDKDSTGFKKISLIDNLGLSMSYNFAAKERPWSDLRMNIRLKWWKNYTFNMNAVFATYAYELDDNGRPYVGTHTEWSRGRFGRFQGMSQNISYTLTPEKLKRLFGRGDDNDDRDKKKNKDDEDGIDTDIESNVDDVMIEGQRGAKKKSGGGKTETDDDGYMKFNMPWSITFGYGISMRENTGGEFNKETMRYGYKFSQTLNVTGNVRISDGWNITFSTGYDFDNHKVSMTTASLGRDLHCFNMSASVVLAPYTSYNFTFRCNAATLTDALKYDKRSGMSSQVQWY